MHETLNVKEVNIKLVKELTDKGTKYILLQDKSADFTFDNMINAINLFADKGWKCVNIAAYAHGERLGLDNIMYALLQHPYVKNAEML